RCPIHSEGGLIRYGSDSAASKASAKGSISGYHRSRAPFLHVDRVDEPTGVFGPPIGQANGFSYSYLIPNPSGLPAIPAFGLEAAAVGGQDGCSFSGATASRN